MDHPPLAPYDRGLLDGLALFFEAIAQMTMGGVDELPPEQDIAFTHCAWEPRCAPGRPTDQRSGAAPDADGAEVLEAPTPEDGPRRSPDVEAPC